MDILILLIITLFVIAAGWIIKWLAARLKVISAKKKSEIIINTRLKEAELESKQILAEGRVQVKIDREFIEEEIQDRKEAMREHGELIQQKTRLINDRMANIGNLQNIIENRVKELEKQDEIKNQLKEKFYKELEKILRTTRVLLKEELCESLVNEEKLDAKHIIYRAENEAQRIAEVRAKDILISSLQALPMSKVVEYNSTSLNMGGQDMINCLIRKEGRYIRFLENILDVEIYIEDTPDGLSLTSPDHIKREVARATIDRLFKEARFNPSQIREIIRLVTNEINDRMYKEAVFILRELGIYDFKKEAVRCLGRLLYRYSYGQNNLYHSKETALLAGLMAKEMGANPVLAKRSGLLHDIGKGFSIEGKSHVEIGVELATEWGEDPMVINAIASHHDDTEKECVEATLVQIADGISGARPGARRETVTSYLELVDNLENIAGDFEGVDRAFAIYAGRELRIIANSEIVDDKKAVTLAHDISKEVEEKITYPGKIKITLIREMKQSSYTS